MSGAADRRTRPVPSRCVFVKICGITTEEDALLAVALGADALGFIFAPGSPRQVTPADARDVAEAAPSGTDDGRRLPRRAARARRRDRQQRRSQRCAAARPRAVVRGAVRAEARPVRHPGASAPAIPRSRRRPTARPTSSCSTAPDARLGQACSTGRSPRAFRRGCGCCSRAGSRRATSAEAIRRVRPWGVDVATGVETEPGSGRKDARTARAVPRRRRGVPASEVEADGWVPGRTDGARTTGGDAPMRARRSRAAHDRTPQRGAPVVLEHDRVPSRQWLGRFGEFGGRFVPETLVPALEELEARVPRRVGVRRSSAPSSPSSSASYAGRPDAGHRVPPPLGATRRAGAAQARGPHAHRLAQDQQRARPGAAHAPDGQAPRHRGDRRRPARRRDRDRGGAVRARLHGVHGRGRRRAPGAERVAHAAARRRGDRRSSRGAARSRTRSTRRCATGSRSVETTHYCIGSVVGPHPYPWIVREFQRVVGDEAREQCRAILGGADPDLVVACVGGGSNAIGTFAGFLDTDARLDRRRGRRARARERASTARRSTAACPACCTARGRCSSRTRTARSSRRTRSAPGLDYPGVGPEHARARRRRAGPSTSPRPTTRRSPASSCSPSTEGIVPALEPAHAIGWLAREAGRAVPTGSTVLVTLSGRGDKDAAQVAERLDRRADSREPRGAPARPPRRRAQAARPVRHRRPRRRTGSTSCARSPTPAPTRSRSASRSPTR